MSVVTVQYAEAVPEVSPTAVEPGVTASLGGGDIGSHPGRPAGESARIVMRWAIITPDGPSGTFQEDDASAPGDRCREPGDRVTRSWIGQRAR